MHVYRVVYTLHPSKNSCIAKFKFRVVPPTCQFQWPSYRRECILSAERPMSQLLKTGNHFWKKFITDWDMGKRKIGRCSVQFFIVALFWKVLTLPLDSCFHVHGWTKRYCRLFITSSFNLKHWGNHNSPFSPTFGASTRYKFWSKPIF